MLKVKFSLIKSLLICTIGLLLSSCEYPVEFERNVFKDPASDLYSRGPMNLTAEIYMNSDLEYKGRIIKLRWNDISETKKRSTLWRKVGNENYELMKDLDISKFQNEAYDTVEVSDYYSYIVKTDYLGGYRKQIESEVVKVSDWVGLPKSNSAHGVLMSTTEGNILSINSDNIEMYNSIENSWEVIGDLPCIDLAAGPIQLVNHQIIIICSANGKALEINSFSTNEMVWSYLGKLERGADDFSTKLKIFEISNSRLLIVGAVGDSYSLSQIKAEVFDLNSGLTKLADPNPDNIEEYIFDGLPIGEKIDENQFFIDFNYSGNHSYILETNNFTWRKLSRRDPCNKIYDGHRVEDKIILLCDYYHAYYISYDLSQKSWSKRTHLIPEYAGDSFNYTFLESSIGALYTINRAGNLYVYNRDEVYWTKKNLTIPDEVFNFDPEKKTLSANSGIVVHNLTNYSWDVYGFALLNTNYIDF